MAITRIAGAALNQTPLDWNNNIKNIIDAIEEAKNKKADILCLPELCISGYGCEDLFLSNWLPSKCISFLDTIRKACMDITVAIGLPMRHKGILYNCACLIHNQKILGFNPKQNLANDGVHYEPRWFTPWKPGITDTFQHDNKTYPFGDILHIVDGIKIGFEICEDAWQEQLRPGKWLFSHGVDLILNPSASHFAFGKSKLREALVVSSSRKFNCTYVYANLLGNEAGRMIFDGEILIAQKGEILQRNTRLSFKNINLVVAGVDLKHITKPVEENINQDDHDKNIEFVKASSLALFDYMRKSKSNGFVLSLSGGADSSTCAILVAEMIKRGSEELGMEFFLQKALLEKHLGKIKEISAAELNKKITSLLLSCAYQGTKNSTVETFHSAEKLAESIGATFYHWLIDDEVSSYTSKIETALVRKLTWETDDISLQNIQARARSPIIWMLTNIKNALLMATSNRSEGDVGYTTMDGDTSGSISPIAAVDKYFILQWLKWAEKELGYGELKYVNTLSPSAELRPHEFTQTDEADLMPYHMIVKIEELAIRDRKSPVEVYEILRLEQFISNDLLKSYIIKFYKLWARSQWKRERFAPSFHLDDFNVDSRTWCRFPILTGGFESEILELENMEG